MTLDSGLEVRIDFEDEDPRVELEVPSYTKIMINYSDLSKIMDAIDAVDEDMDIF